MAGTSTVIHEAVRYWAVTASEHPAAIPLSGHVAVPAYPPDPRHVTRSVARLTAMVIDCGATGVLASDDLRRALEPLAANLPGLEQLDWIDMRLAVDGPMPA